MNLRTEHLARCLQTLEKSLEQLNRAPEDSIDYEIYRNAVVKGFELTLETAGKLLRHAAKHGLLEPAAVERWFAYRDNRNNTAHDYGQSFALETLALMPDFLNDARRLETTLREKFGHDET